MENNEAFELGDLDENFDSSANDVDVVIIQPIEGPKEELYEGATGVSNEEFVLDTEEVSCGEEHRDVDLDENFDSNANDVDVVIIQPNEGPKEELYEEATTALSTEEFASDTEEVSYEEVHRVVDSGNGLKLEALLADLKKKDGLRDWRSKDNVTLYADAITDSYLDVINVLLKYDIPLGDALIRAIDSEYDDAIKTICKYLSTREDLKKSVLESHCDNDDLHPALTPMILAAQRNNFEAVQILSELGATIEEPSFSLGGDVTLTQAVSTIHIYRALSQPAYILATQTDIFSYGFSMTDKLKKLSQAWTDFGAELEEIARRIEVFVAEMLGQSNSTEEILSLFRYHTSDEYRDPEGKQHPLSKVFEALKYKQQEFIAHPHCQKAIILQYYRDLLDWNERGFVHQLLLMFLVVLGYPIIGLLYIFVPVRRVVSFVEQPYVQFLMNAGSGFTFLTFVILKSVVDSWNYSPTQHALTVIVFIWLLGIAWLQIRTLMRFGVREYLGNSANIYDTVLIGLYLVIFFLYWKGSADLSSTATIQRSVRSADLLTLPHNDTSFDNLKSTLTLALDGLHTKLSSTVVEVITGALTNCSGTGLMHVDSTQFPGPQLPAVLQQTVQMDQFDPAIVSRSLFAITVIIAFLRLMNLLLISESVGPLKISLGSMTGDILKFCGIFFIIWLAFAIGMFQNYYSAGQAVQRQCSIEGNDDVDDCSMTGFSTFVVSMMNLYWTLFGMVETDVLVLPPKFNVAENIGLFLFIAYHIVAVLVLLNALIGMLSNTYNLTEERADTEWKFHRALLWATYLHPVHILPPPLNLIPSSQTMRAMCGYFFGGCSARCKRQAVVNQKNMHSEKEFADYMRVLKLARSRYIQSNLSTATLNAEEVRPRDIQLLRNDFASYRFFMQSRLENLQKKIVLSNEKSGDVSEKVEELDPLNTRNAEVIGETGGLGETINKLHEESTQLREESEAEIARMDAEIAELKNTILSLHADIKRLLEKHAAEIAKRDRREAELDETIHRLETDKEALTNFARGLQTDKSELTQIVGELHEEIQRLRLLIPKPTKEQPGFFKTIANAVEKTVSDYGQEAKPGFKTTTSPRRESPKETPNEAAQSEAIKPETLSDHSPEKHLEPSQMSEVQQEPNVQQELSFTQDEEIETYPEAETTKDEEINKNQEHEGASDVHPTEEDSQNEEIVKPELDSETEPEQEKDREQEKHKEQEQEPAPEEQMGFFRRIANKVEKAMSELGLEVEAKLESKPKLSPPSETSEGPDTRDADPQETTFEQEPETSTEASQGPKLHQGLDPKPERVLSESEHLEKAEEDPASEVGQPSADTEDQELNGHFVSKASIVFRPKQAPHE